ncbi:hypothetical protein IV102_33710 [bacterium]|nr:hypothetical protein [bacterium]
MNGYVALPIRHLVCALKTRPQDSKDYQSAAASWLIGCRESLELARPLVPWSAAADELFHQADLELKAALRAVEDPHLFEEEKAEALEEAVTRYYGQLFQLQALERERPAFSPMSCLDQLIRVAFNVLQGRCPVYELQCRFPLLQTEVACWRRLDEVRRHLHTDLPWPPSSEEHLQVIEGGLGALSRFLEQGLPSLLEQAIQLLGKGSADYAQVLHGLQAEMATRQRFSRHQAIEFWLLLQQHPDDWEQAITGPAWDRLFQEVDEALRILQIAQRAGLGITQPELLAGAARIHQQAFDYLGELAVRAREPQEVADLLNPAWDRLERLRQVVTAALADLQNRFGGAPRMLELLEMLGQAAAGQLAPWALKAELELRLRQHQAMVDNLSAVPAPQSTAPMLAAHERAFLRMLLFCEDEKVEHLVEGWKVLALTMPPLLAWEAQLRREISGKGKADPQLRCIRCGHLQKPQKVCAQCGGSMPMFQIDTEVDYQPVMGEAPVGGKVQVADHLSDLVQGLNFGATTWEHVTEEIQSQLKALDKARDSFEKEVVKMLGSGGEVLDTYSQFFLVRLGQLAQTLIEMGKAADRHDLVLLKGQLGAYSPLQDELLEFQKRITAGLNITPA